MMFSTLPVPPVFRLSTLIAPVVADVPDPVRGTAAAPETVKGRGAPSSRAVPPVLVVELAIVVEPILNVVVR
jgi:hypothetical protein